MTSKLQPLYLVCEETFDKLCLECKHRKKETKTSQCQIWKGVKESYPMLRDNLHLYFDENMRCKNFERKE